MSAYELPWCSSCSVNMEINVMLQKKVLDVSKHWHQVHTNA